VRRLKICIAASAGGHLSQLLKLSHAWQGQNVFWVTTGEVVRGSLREYGQIYAVGECNRQNPIRVLSVFSKCLKIVAKDRPDVVISTGAAVGCIMCFLGKLRGAKVIWMDSVTNVKKLSLSGRMVRLIADLFLVQWPELAEKYGNAEYVGTVI